MPDPDPTRASTRRRRPAPGPDRRARPARSLGPAGGASFRGPAVRGLLQLGFLAEEGWSQLRAHWRTHLLTLLGIAWGAACVVLLLSVGAGFNRFLDLGVEKTGDRWTEVDPSYTTSETAGARPGRKITFTPRDLERLRAGVPSASAIAGEVLDFALAETSKRTRATAVSAASPSIRRIRNHRVARGRFFDDEDQRLGRRVAVLGAHLAQVLYDSEPIGRTLQLNGVPFVVVGVLEAKGFQLFTNLDLHDNMVFVPLSAGQRLIRFGDGETIRSLLLNPQRLDDEELLRIEVREALWPLHRLADAETAAIEFASVSEFMKPLRAIGFALQVLLGFVGTVTLAMAAVGVANLMIAIASERRREFAVRRACGARRGDVSLQLLVETGVVVLAAGAVGVGLGLGLVALLRALPLPPDLPAPSIPPSVVLTTFVVLVAVGVAAGIAPARIASRVDPGSALRSI